MKTTDIVKGLLEIADGGEYDDSGHCYYCNNKEPYGKHTHNCKYVQITEAAKEYLKLMNVK